MLNKVLDILIFKMNSRFENIKNSVENFNFLSPKSFVKKEYANKLNNKYKSDVSNATESEIVRFKNVMSTEAKKKIKIL